MSTKSSDKTQSKSSFLAGANKLIGGPNSPCQIWQREQDKKMRKKVSEKIKAPLIDPDILEQFKKAIAQ